jgi:hypothetical protein
LSPLEHVGAAALLAGIAIVAFAFKLVLKAGAAGLPIAAPFMPDMAAAGTLPAQERGVIAAENHSGFHQIDRNV